MKLPNALTTFVDNNFEDDFGLLADSMKALMFQNVPHLFRSLDFEDDNNFLDPLFLLKVSYNPVPSFSYEQILFGYISDDKKPEQMKVLSSDKGIVYLPRVGYLLTSVLLKEIDLFFNRDSREITLESDGKSIPFEFTPVMMLDDTKIELVRYNNPLNDDNFGTKEAQMIVDVEAGFNDHHEHVEKAMAIIKREYPWYYSYINTAVKKILVFYNDQVRSFASKTTTGTVYISARKEYTEVFFLEDIIHQCAHNVLYIMTGHMEDYFAVDAKNGRINQFNNQEDDKRTIYSAYHGMFSLLNINTLFSILIQKKVFEGQKEHELLGRFSDNLKRLGRNIQSVKYKEIYTEKGWALLSAIEECYGDLNKEFGALSEKYDTSRQPYVFSYSLFLEDNPL